jgi:hypothetical protein
MDGEGGTQIVQAGLMAGIAVITSDASPEADSAEHILGILPGYCFAPAGEKCRRSGGAALLGQILSKNLPQILTDRHQARLVEFALADEQDSSSKIDVGPRQG